MDARNLEARLATRILGLAAALIVVVAASSVVVTRQMLGASSAPQPINITIQGEHSSAETAYYLGMYLSRKIH